MKRVMSALVVLLIAVWPALAQGENDWLQRPYHLQVYVQVAPHPLLTSEYLGRLQRELRDTLQRDLGPTAVVDVLAESAVHPKSLHPLMNEVTRQGWDALDKPTHPITGKKVHLLRLAYEDGEYLLEGRQVDGDTGVVSPLRKNRTGDRSWVSRMAALMIGQDFGMTAAVTEINGQTVSFQLRAAGNGEAESIKIRNGEVFALSRILRSGNNELLGRREADALLFVTGINTATGRCTGRVYYRYVTTLQKDRATVGFRALKLGTVRAVLQVRVVDAKSNAPVAGCKVLLYPGGFPNKNDSSARPPQALGATDSEGRINSPNPIDHVAFARFELGPVGVNIPIALYDDELVTIRLSDVESADRLREFDAIYRQWDQQRAGVYSFVQAEYEEISVLKEQAKFERMEKLAAKLKEDIAGLKEGFVRVQEMGKLAGANAEPKLKLGAEYVKKLDEVADSLNKMLKEEKDPSPATKARNQGQLAYENQKFDECIKLFEESLKLEPNQPTLRNRLDRLKKAWNIPRSNAAHRQAREFFTKTWPGLGWRDMREKLEDCEKHMEVLRTNTDFLTAQVLLRTNLEKIRQLDEQLTTVKASTKVEDQEKIPDMEDLLAKLREMSNDLRDFIVTNTR